MEFADRQAQQVSRRQSLSRARRCLAASEAGQDLGEELETSASKSAKPLFQQVYEVLRQRIVDGQLAVGGRLPATRRFAEEVGESKFPDDGHSYR